MCFMTYVGGRSAYVHIPYEIHERNTVRVVYQYDIRNFRILYECHFGIYSPSFATVGRYIFLHSLYSWIPKDFGHSLCTFFFFVSNGQHAQTELQLHVFMSWLFRFSTAQTRSTVQTYAFKIRTHWNWKKMSVFAKRKFGRKKKSFLAYGFNGIEMVAEEGGRKLSFFFVRWSLILLYGLGVCSHHQS